LYKFSKPVTTLRWQQVGLGKQTRLFPVDFHNAYYHVVYYCVLYWIQYHAIQTLQETGSAKF